MRITLTIPEVATILSSLQQNKERGNNDTSIDKIITKLQNEIKKPITSSKRNATKKATSVRIDKTKAKITTAVNLMNLENEKITPYSVSKKSNVSYNTVKKYEYLLISI